VSKSFSGLFSGVRVVELAYYVFVPGSATLLADQGAEVIKVEAVGTGDPYRTLVIGDGREVMDLNLAMEQNNRRKKSIALDLKSADGRQAFLELIKTADIFLTGLRPKALKSLKFDVEDLRAVNPRLIYARGNGLGFRGKEIDKPGYDGSCFHARGGMASVMSRPGQPIVPSRPAMGDHTGSISLAYAMAGALYHRAVSGEPTVVETSLLATAAWVLSGDITHAQSPGYKVHHEHVYRFPLMSPYATKDGIYIQLMLLDPEPYWPGLCKMLECEALIKDPRFVDAPARIANAQVLIPILTERMARRTWAEWRPLFEAWEAPWERVNTVYDLYDDPQMAAIEAIFDAKGLKGQDFRLVSGPVSVNGHPSAGDYRCAPGMGQHTDELLREIGYSDTKITDLKTRRAAQ
jgi:crotonobetainyl-CoA:carnitine CoA-transferase CaiB-like acyl-CoA transferase